MFIYKKYPIAIMKIKINIFLKIFDDLSAFGMNISKYGNFTDFVSIDIPK